MGLPSGEARRFYTQHASEGKWSKRELQRQIERKAFERAEIVDRKRELFFTPQLGGNFKYPYFCDLKINRFMAGYKGQMGRYLNWLSYDECQLSPVFLACLACRLAICLALYFLLCCEGRDREFPSEWHRIRRVFQNKRIRNA